MITYNQYSMRPIEYKDLKMILDWRNSERIHSVLLTDHKITWEEHSRWFEKIKNNPVKLNFVFEYQFRPIGYIGYTDFNPEAKTCSISLYIGDNHNISPLAGIIIYYMNIAYAFEKLGMKKLDSFAFESNETSITINKFVGFHEAGNGNYTIQKNGKEELVIHFALTLEEWEAMGPPLKLTDGTGGGRNRRSLTFRLAKRHLKLSGFAQSFSIFGEAA